MSDDTEIRFQIEHNGSVFDIDMSDFDGMEWSNIKRLTGGMTPARLFQAAGELDFEAIAALIYTHRKRENSRVVYEKVLKGLKVSNTKFLDADDDAEGEAEPPSSTSVGDDS